MTIDASAPEAPALPIASADAPPAAPLVSVLVRSTGRSTLQQALDSVAAQTHQAIEVLVVAASTGHPVLPERVGPWPLRFIPTDRPLRRSEAANRALAAARGDYLLFLDDDDWLMPVHLATLVQRLQQQPQVRVAYTGVALVDGQGQPLGQAFDLPFDAVRQLAGNLTPIHAVLFSAELVARGCRFDETLDLYEDWDFWLQLARHSVFLHQPGVSAAYRIHDSSGVHAEARVPGAATLRLYEKWRTRWSPQQLAGLMQRVWAHDELLLQRREADARAERQRQEAAARLVDAESRHAQQAALLQSQVAMLAEQAGQLRGAEERIAREVAHGQALARQLEDQQRRTAELEHLLARQMARAEGLANDRQALLSSTSWRVTAPLRAVGDWRAARRAAAARGPAADAAAHASAGLGHAPLAVRPGPARPERGPATGRDGGAAWAGAAAQAEALAPLGFYLLPPHGRRRVTLVLDRFDSAEAARRWTPVLRFAIDLAERREASLRLITRFGPPDGRWLDALLLEHGAVLRQGPHLAQAPWDDAAAEFDRLQDEPVITADARNLASVLSGLDGAAVTHWLSDADEQVDRALALLQQRPAVQPVAQDHGLQARLGPRMPPGLGLRLSVSQFSAPGVAPLEAAA